MLTMLHLTETGPTFKTQPCFQISPKKSCGLQLQDSIRWNVLLVFWCSAGVPVSSRVSAKIQQLVNTLKRPKRPPLREFFVDDFEELLEGKRLYSVKNKPFFVFFWSLQPNEMFKCHFFISLLFFQRWGLIFCFAATKNLCSDKFSSLKIIPQRLL